MKLKIFPISLGCPKNLVDTEKLLGSLAPMQVVQTYNKAHIVFINTCGFILTAVQESVQTILDLAQDIQELPPAKRPLLVVAGCLPGRYGIAPLQAELPEVDLWLNLKNMSDWPALVKAALEKRFDHEFQGLELITGRFLSTPPSYAYLKISEGCEHKCAFCSIPIIRGPLHSFEPQKLVAEANQLVEQGVKELVLVAQDLTAYGHDRADWENKRALPQLLQKLADIPNLARLRLMYLYPTGLTREFLEFLRELGGPVLPYFDVPIQHSHPDILSRMGRPFAKNAEKTLNLIREIFPHAALRTSLITGFPGEQEQHFEHLLNFVQKIQFDNLGVFSYQAEEGTKAALMPNEVPEDVRLARRDIIMQEQASISEEKLKRYVGEHLEVLVDSPQGEWPGLFVGRTWFQAPEVDGSTYVSAPPEQTLDKKAIAPGSMVQAEITDSSEYDLNGLV